MKFVMKQEIILLTSTFLSLLRFPGDPMLQNIPMFPTGPYPPFYGPHYAAINQAQMQQWFQAYYGR